MCTVLTFTSTVSLDIVVSAFIKINQFVVMASGYTHTIAIVLQRERVSRRNAIITLKTSRMRFLYSLNVNASPR